jgi:phosphoenolpyruvate synthase/pyruvate phosphate dikinase
MSSCIFGFHEIDKTKFSLVGGKGANLGELNRIEDISVPGGFCVSTEAFKRIISENLSINGLLQRLKFLSIEDRDKIRELSLDIRKTIEEIIIPVDIREEISRFLSRHDAKNAWAVRSSATAEDLPTASFAGQQDTYLNIIGEKAIFQHISQCWASLYTERAVIYRLRNGFDHLKVHLAVVVQKMVFPQTAGILFTADPVSGNRKVLSIDASFGLGEAMVSGLVNADNYKVSHGKVIDKKISTKKLAIYALQEGGTKEQEIEPLAQSRQALTDEEILQLDRIGRKIEDHFGQPQDIEWCFADHQFYIVQRRPITTLFPVPGGQVVSPLPPTEANDNHVYISVGHQQMMTDAIKPLGLSIWQLTTNATMHTAGGRLFVDLTPMLALESSRNTIMDVVGKSDPLIKDALRTIMDRGDFIKLIPGEPVERGTGKSKALPDFKARIDYDPAIVPGLIKSNQAAVEELKQNIQKESGTDLFDFILEDIGQLKKSLSDPKSFSVFITAMNASTWVNEKMMEWLGEKNAADTLSQSVPNNITSEMGLALLDVADVIRSYPAVIEYLKHVRDDDFFEQLVKLDGGQETQTAIYDFLSNFGMRCAGEIDITRPRWSEKPVLLIPMILSNIKKFEHNASHRKFEEGQRDALNKEHELLDRLKQLPDGNEKAGETKRMIELIRNYSGYREYPKYGMISRYLVYKQALLKEAVQLVKAGVIHEKEDIYYLDFEELREVVRTRKLNYDIINKQKDAFKIYEKLNPPRVITSDGEIVTGRYRHANLPAKAIAGLAVSSGEVEGRARVILNMEDADLEDGDILVTSFTDPGWTPLFLSITGLVTEVGGLMTHGAVIAREYGLPAVVGVENATKLIKDGQRIRVHGTEGYIEIL